MELQGFKDRLYAESFLQGISNVAGTWMTYRFAYLIYRKFKEWDAYKLGLIDAQGNIIRDPKTAEEKRSFGAFDNLVRKIKKVITKYAGEAAILNTLLAVYLLKKESYTAEERTFNHIIKLEIADELTHEEIDLLEKLLIEIKTNERHIPTE